MSSDQNTTQGPVASGESSQPLLDGHHEPVWLCEECRKAHDRLLCDAHDLEYWEETRINGRSHIELNDVCAGPVALPPDEWPALPDLLYSAQAGCGFCDFLRKAILSDESKDLWNHLDEKRLAEARPSELMIDLRYYRWVGYHPYRSRNPSRPRYHLDRLEVSLTSVDLPHICLTFQIEAASDCLEVADWLALHPPAIQTREEAYITKFVATELQKWNTEPENIEGAAAFLPERLLDVGSGSLRLVQRSDIANSMQQRPQYAALSYCWGSPRDAKTQTKTTEENLTRHLKGLDFDALSPVLKDAVEFTRSLSIRYLWVDALCIFQDDFADWQSQCSQMDNIYGKARVTFIAAASKTCREGFLNPNPNGLRLPYQSTRRPDIKGSFMLYFTHASSERERSSWVLSENPWHSRELVSSQWARRGWTFQEDAMAGARVLFGKSGAYFGTQYGWISTDGAITSDQRISTRTLRGASVDDLHHMWEEVAIRYSRFTESSFTNPADVLPALSGLARLFGDKLQAKYVAGHWADDSLRCTLLWTVRGDSAVSGLPRPQALKLMRRHAGRPYLIPSWSCLGRGRIEFLARSNDRHKNWSELNILDVHAQLVGKDPYGAIEDACLTLEGFVLDLEYLPELSAWREAIPVDENWRRVESLRSSNGFKLRLPADAADSYTRKFYFNPIDNQLGKTTERPDAHHEYEVTLDFPFRSWLTMMATPSFDQMISQMTLLLVAGQKLGESQHGHGLALLPVTSLRQKMRGGQHGHGLALRPVTMRSYLRVGVFGPQSPSEDSLSSLKRLMKKEKIKLY